jgi:hypothetical protein
MSSGRRSDDNILALANTSLGRRQTTPASFCSADNSSSPSGSLTSKNQPQTAVSDVAESPKQRPCPAEHRSRPQRSRDSVDHRAPFQHKLLFLCAISPPKCVSRPQPDRKARFTKLRTECKWVAPHWSHVPFDRLYSLCPFQSASRVLTSLFLGASICDGAADIEESTPGFDI